MRIKCPKCNKSMKVVLVWEDTNKYSTTYIREYKCKCGCAFEVNFVAEEPKILNNSIDK